MFNANTSVFLIRKSGFLGSGEFATVDKGIWRGSKGTVDVAVKTLSESATEAEKIRFLQEAVVMGQFVHPNIVQLHGIVTRGDPVSATHILRSNVPPSIPQPHPLKIRKLYSGLQVGYLYSRDSLS